MSMPLSNACNPFALEIMIGRLPDAAALDVAPFPAAGTDGALRPKALLTLAMALPAREVKKNLRRDHNSINPPKTCGGHYSSHRQKLKSTGETNWLFALGIAR